MKWYSPSIRFWKDKNQTHKDPMPIEQPVQDDIILLQCYNLNEERKANPLYLEFMLCMFAVVVLFLVTLVVVDDVRNDHINKYHKASVVTNNFSIDAITK